MKPTKQTPLTKQYNEIKEKYPDSVLFFSLGDFYETFGKDAILTAKVCGITLTKRNNGAAGKTELAGFPHHQLDNYLPKMVKAGYRVAVCEQLEDPKKAKGLVKRGVTEIVTPGVALYDKMLDAGRNNFILSIKKGEQKKGNSSIENLGLAWSDISTGELYFSECRQSSLSDQISQISPSEILISKEDFSDTKVLDILKKSGIHLTKIEDWHFSPVTGVSTIKGHFQTSGLKGFGIENESASFSALSGLLHYIEQLQGGLPKQYTTIKKRSFSNYMQLDEATRRNLDITYSSYSGSKEGSLFGLIDRCKTAMGSRNLKSWISNPLIKLEPINGRLDGVEELYSDKQRLIRLQSLLSGLCDLERIGARVAGGRFIPRDFRSVAECLYVLPQVVKELQSPSLLLELSSKLESFDDLLDLLDKTISEDPSNSIGDGNSIKRGVNSELDEYLSIKRDAKQWLTDYKEKLKVQTGLSNIKIGSNNVFGYYIEISRVNSDKLDLEALGLNRRQTLANTERYISEELSEFEQKIYSADDEILRIERAILTDLGIELTNWLEKLQKLSHALGKIDTIASFAEISADKGFVRPEINNSKILQIEEGKHPIVDNNLPHGVQFVANDTNLDDEESRFIVLTGPNMSGKSCYLRQNGIIVLLAQSGCFVPAKSASIGLVDRIFTRVGAHDNMLSGESTFLVEMHESATIVNSATDRSLILLDELGRGTSTFDGISIAWSISEYIHNTIGARCIFATHYHELNRLEELYNGISNMSVSVKEIEGKLLFTHKVEAGGTDHSFGIQVASMAGLPYQVIKRSQDILEGLESNSNLDKIDAKEKVKDIKAEEVNEHGQLAIFTFHDDIIRKKLQNMNVEAMTPIQAFEKLYELVEDSRKK
ncbi:MAG: DNA mismatch repair protein MutS [Candidatus Kapaibacteriales bacterium]